MNHQLQFSTLHFDHLEEYNDFIKQYEPHGDFTFNNLMSWLALFDTVSVAKLNGNLVLKFFDAFYSFEPSFTVLGSNKAEETLQTIFEYLKSKKLKQELVMVPDYFVKALKKETNFTIELDRDNCDYIYSTKKITHHDIPELRAFRRQINYFLKNYAQHVKTYSFDLKPVENRIKLINSLHSWDNVYTAGSNDQKRVEGLSIDRALLNCSRLDYRCLVLEGPDGIDGFSIFQLPPQEKFAVFNYIKCDYSKRSIFDFLFFCTVSYMQTLGVEFVNFEQDLGIEGLRYHKQKLGPVRMLEKFIITPRQ